MASSRFIKLITLSISFIFGNKYKSQGGRLEQEGGVFTNSKSLRNKWSVWRKQLQRYRGGRDIASWALYLTVQRIQPSFPHDFYPSLYLTANLRMETSIAQIVFGLVTMCSVSSSAKMLYIAFTCCALFLERYDMFIFKRS